MPSMRISLGTLSSPASRFPLLLPGEPSFRAPYLAPLRTAGERVRMVTTAAAGERRRAGYVSVVERALAAEEEYRRARAEVQRKGVEVEGYGIEGISIITHAHLDHIDMDGNDVSLSDYDGKVLLIVNVASKCGLTHTNYKEMNVLYDKYKDKGFEILAFPCNQFAGQEPGSNDEIKDVACTMFKAEFPIFDKCDSELL